MREVKRFPLCGKLLSCAVVALAALAPCARADYVVLQSGQRIHVTGYERVGDALRLTMTGGTLEIPADTAVQIEPEDTFLPVKVKLLDVPFANFISESARAHGVAPELVASVIAVESNFNPKAVSSKKASGLMQLLPQTAAQYGVKNIFDPEENVNAGTRYLKELLAKYHDLTLALAAYNAGPERVDQYGRHVPPYLETMKYVQRIAKSYAKIKSQTTAEKQPG
jgi:hypothetical protein